MLRKNEDDDDEAPADPAVPRHRHIMNMHAGTMLWIQLSSFEEYGDFLADAKGSCFSTVCAPLQLPDHRHRRPPRCLCDAGPGGSIVDRRNAPMGYPIIVPNMVLVVVS